MAANQSNERQFSLVFKADNSDVKKAFDEMEKAGEG